MVGQWWDSGGTVVGQWWDSGGTVVGQWQDESPKPGQLAAMYVTLIMYIIMKQLVAAVIAVVY